MIDFGIPSSAFEIPYVNYYNAYEIFEESQHELERVQKTMTNQMSPDQRRLEIYEIKRKRSEIEKTITELRNELLKIAAEEVGHALALQQKIQL